MTEFGGATGSGAEETLPPTHPYPSDALLEGFASQETSDTNISFMQGNALVFSCWGKWGDGDAPTHSLLGHLLDTSAVALALWDDWLPTSLVELFTEAWSASGSPGGDARSWFAVLAGCHDIGKADPVFQGQVNSRGEETFAAFTEDLASSGLISVPDDIRGMLPERGSPSWRLFRHEAMSGNALHRVGEPAWACTAVSGHHGRYLPSGQDAVKAKAYVKAYAGWQSQEAADWLTLQESLVATVYRASGVSQPASDLVQLREGFFFGPLIPFVTGFIVLSDWLASDDRFVRTAPQGLLEENPESYLVERYKQVKSRLGSWIGYPSSPAGAFPEVFKGLQADRPVQEWALDAPDSGLTILTVPMGEGKTETALWRHLHHHPSRRDGLVFALPTMATADALFDRVRDFYSDIDTFGHLAHGMAKLNSYYSESTAAPSCLHGEDSDHSGLSPQAWFTGRHRGLLAPVTVSTCDQVLAAAVSHKFVPLRLFSLATKHVILDEVHTYDPYQQVLLERLLTWLAYAGGRVTLLSATLPKVRLDGIVKAWGEGSALRGKTLASSQSDPSIGTLAMESVYPAVHTVDVSGNASTVVVDSSRSYLLSTKYVQVPGAREGKISAIVQEVLASWQKYPDSRIGVIVNTVKEAQEIHSAVSATGRDVFLLHSRMTAAQRSEKAQEILGKVGKQGDHQGCLVIGTQVLEASLDLDFDFLVSEIAPMSSLLQRSGRLWRHSMPLSDGSWQHAPERAPYRSSSPLLTVFVPEEFTRWTVAPYTVAEIRKTWEALKAGGLLAVRIPEDIQMLVDEANVTWGDLSSAENGEEQEREELSKHLAKETNYQQRASEVGVNAAALKTWKPQAWDRDSQLDKMTRGNLWSEEAQTRLREAATVTLLVHDPSGEDPLAWAGEISELYGTVSKSKLLEVMKSTVPVSGSTAVRLIKAGLEGVDLTVWRTSAPMILRDVIPISVAKLAGAGFVLDKDLGLYEESRA